MKNNNDINELRENINTIQKGMNLGSSQFRFIYSSRHYRLVFLLAGIWSAFFSASYGILSTLFDTIPDTIMYIYYIALGAGWAALIIVRTLVSFRAATAAGQRLNFAELMKQIFATRMWLAIIPLTAVFALLPIRFSEILNSSTILPYIGIGLGLILIVMGVSINELPYITAGFLICATGTLILLLFELPLYASFGIVFSPGCFLFTITEAKQRRNN